MGGLAEALTPQGLLGQLPFVLLIAAILSTRADRMRRLVAAGAAIGFIHAFVSRGDLIASLWWTLLLGATLLAVGRKAAENSRVRFSDEEEAMLSGVFKALPRGRARHLLDQGLWLNGEKGSILLKEEEPVTHLYYLAAGQARVISHDRHIATCAEGDLIGEVAIMSDEKASATVVLDGPARFWCAPANVLRPYLETHEEVRHALEQGFSQSIKNKLRQSNERIAEAGGVMA